MEEYEHRIKGEPTDYDAPADFYRQYEMLHRKLEQERARSDAVDAKAATLFAGTVALLGFSLDHAGGKVEALSLLLFAWPLICFYRAYRTMIWDDAPSAAECLKFPWFPQTTVASANVAIANSIEANRPKIDQKARMLNSGFRGVLIVLAIVVGIRVGAVLLKGVPNDNGIPATATTTGPAGATKVTRPPNTREPNPTRGKGRRDGQGAMTTPY